MDKITEKERKCVRYLSGEMSPEDQYVFEIELSLDQDLKALFESYREIWKAYADEDHFPTNRWQEIDRTDLAHKLSIALLAVITVILIWPGKINPEVYPQRLMAGVGERKSLVLPDSSRVILNSGSSIVYPNHFGDTREVQVAGEAYFEVTADPEHPFVVHSEGFDVRVLGTEFSVYNASNLKEVSLKEGKVEFFQSDNQDKITLSPHERLTWNSSTNEVQKENFDPEKELSWTRNTLWLDNILFHDALEEINKFYGVQFVINEPSLLDQHITGVFKEENLDDFIQSLEFIADVQVRKLQGKIFLINSIEHD